MKLLRWMTAMAGAGALAVITPVTSTAQDCNGFATCATATATPSAMGSMLSSTQDRGQKGPRDLVYFAQPEKTLGTTQDKCPSPNGEHGAESVLEHNKHCNDNAELTGGKPEHVGPSANANTPVFDRPPENAATTPDHEAVPEVTASVTPEPASIVLLGTALLTLGAGALSRRKRA